MTADECPLPLALGSEQSYCPHGIDELWDKFLSSLLLAEKVGCDCGVTVVSSNQNIQKKSHNEVTLKKLENTRPSLSESLATLRPKFIKQSQLRVSCTHKQGTIKAKSKKPCCSEEEKEKKRKFEAAENRLRVKFFQKEVLDPLHSGQVIPHTRTQSQQKPTSSL